MSTRHQAKWRRYLMDDAVRRSSTSGQDDSYGDTRQSMGHLLPVVSSSIRDGEPSPVHVLSIQIRLPGSPARTLCISAHPTGRKEGRIIRRREDWLYLLDAAMEE